MRYLKYLKQQTSTALKPKQKDKIFQLSLVKSIVEGRMNSQIYKYLLKFHLDFPHFSPISTFNPNPNVVKSLPTMLEHLLFLNSTFPIELTHKEKYLF